MNNAAFKAFIEEFGDQICIIVLDNTSHIYVGYPSSPLKKLDQIEFKTFGGVDMFGVPSNPLSPNETKLGISHIAWHPTLTIQGIYLIDKDHTQYRMDAWQY